MRFARLSPELTAKLVPVGVCDTLDAQEYPVQGAARPLAKTSRDVALSFLRLANLDNDVVVRLSRYEAALWRQLAQTLLMLQTMKRR